MSVSTSSVGTLPWFARHELNLSWRDFVRMMAAGKPGRERAVVLFLAISVLVIHLIALVVLKPLVEAGITMDKATLTVIGGSLILTFSLMMSQAMEHVTRAFYSRSDLDLILSSPTAIRRLFTVRIIAIAIATSMLSLVLFGPAIHLMALLHSPRWLAAYPVIMALGASATALSLVLTIWMFDRLGAKTTRLAAQIIAAVVGAGFIIGIQLAAIYSLGSLSRLEFLASEQVTGLLPGIDSFAWIPARAVTGDLFAVVICILAGAGFLAAAIHRYADTFAERVVLAAGIAQSGARKGKSRSAFKSRSTASILRFKEWKLLMRDHWLISQSLMQILYLIPPAFMLWQGFGSAGALSVVAIPVLVMACGQLAGGLAWLAISGEDAPQLVETAPVPPGAIIRAKVEAVLGAIGIIILPIILLIAVFDLCVAIVATAGIAVASISATMIQLWFRSQAKRSNFRRRQTSSKVATIAEAFSSILWAGTAGIIAAGAWLLAPVTALLALTVLWIARSFRPAS